MNFKVYQPTANALYDTCCNEAGMLNNTSYSHHMNSHHMNFFYTGSVQQVYLPSTRQDVIVITMVAGGGCGGETHIQSNIQFSGGGGGGGGSIVSVPVNIGNLSSFSLYVGKGGGALGEDGEDSYIQIGSTLYSVTGGKAAILNTRGDHGDGVIDGTDGMHGEMATPSSPVVQGGLGGSSFLGNAQLPGYGSGGKGMDVNSSTVNPGTSGVVMITYYSN
jgi:hypothetical protein